MKAKPQKLGVVVGTVMGGAHLAWAILVWLGWAQALAEFSMWAHMAHFQFTAGPFELSAAVTVVVVASAMGYVVGYVAGTVWNKVHG